MVVDHVKFGLLVTSSIRPVVPDVASAMNWPVPPEEIVCEPGTMLTEVNACVEPPITVNVAVPVAMVLSAFLYCAVMVTEPAASPVATPVAESICAMVVLLELQVTCPDRLTVPPEAVAPTTRKVAWSPGAGTD